MFSSVRLKECNRKWFLSFDSAAYVLTQEEPWLNLDVFFTFFGFCCAMKSPPPPPKCMF